MFHQSLPIGDPTPNMPAVPRMVNHCALTKMSDRSYLSYHALAFFFFLQLSIYMRSSPTFLHEKPAVQARVILRATHNANIVNKEYSELNI